MNAVAGVSGEDLIGRIKAALPDQLAGLVEVLTDGGKGRVSMGSAVRQLFVKARELETFTEGTRELLLAEILAYGGSALANLKRGKGIPYAELLVDTSNYLGGEIDKDRDIDALELAIILRQLEILWDSGRSDLKSAIAAAVGTSAKWQAVKSALTEERAQLGAVEFLCGPEMDLDLVHEGAQRHDGAVGQAWGAIGGRLGRVIASDVGEKVTGKIASLVSSHRVTLPCINHLARIRLMAEMDVRREPSRPVNLPRDVTLDPPVGAASLVMADDAGDAVFSMTPVDVDALPPGAVGLDARKAGVNRWSSLLQAAPTLAAASEVAGARYMKVVVNGPLTLAKDGDGFRGFVRENNRIVEHAKLFEGDLSQVVNAGALFNLASVAVGQKHMADISQHLEKIQEGVDRIAQFQQRARESEIRGAIRYLRQVGPLIMGGDHTQAQFQRLEDCEADLLKVQEHLTIDLSSLVDEAARVEGTGTFGVSSTRDRLAELQEKFDEIGHQWVLCLKARMVACRLLCSFEGTAKTVATRDAAIRADLAWFNRDGGIVVRFTEVVNQRAAQFNSLVESKVELQAHRELLRVLQEATIPRLELEATGAADSFRKLLEETRAPVELLIATERGEVCEVVVL